MNVNQFAQIICAGEAKRKQVNIAQMKEILSVINRATKGVLYAVIRLL